MSDIDTLQGSVATQLWTGGIPADFCARCVEKLKIGLRTCRQRFAVLFYDWLNIREPWLNVKKRDILLSWSRSVCNDQRLQMSDAASTVLVGLAASVPNMSLSSANPMLSDDSIPYGIDIRLPSFLTLMYSCTAITLSRWVINIIPGEIGSPYARDRSLSYFAVKGQIPLRRLVVDLLYSIALFCCDSTAFLSDFWGALYRYIHWPMQTDR